MKEPPIKVDEYWRLAPLDDELAALPVVLSRATVFEVELDLSMAAVVAKPSEQRCDVHFGSRLWTSRLAYKNLPADPCLFNAFGIKTLLASSPS
ncbi:unnamed protein product [Phytophthora lilii]|uniref:Unnamed protein product n=1 Tax=Phytophthora lilii TaxID=2077276 RepID=A0A9W6TX85_9STRA|nr:unnamed protein product [Phytophthora lilii]